MLNKYIWNLYLKSGGNKVVEMFRRNLSEKLTLEYAEEVVRMRRVYCVMNELQYQQAYDAIYIVQSDDKIETTRSTWII